MKPRYDISFGTGPSIDHHFCREWDGDGGCYCTSPDHGLPIEQAREEVAVWLESQAALWRSGKHPSDPERSP